MVVVMRKRSDGWTGVSHYLEAHFALFRRIDCDGLHRDGLVSFPRHSCLALHTKRQREETKEKKGRKRARESQ